MGLEFISRSVHARIQDSVLGGHDLLTHTHTDSETAFDQGRTKHRLLGFKTLQLLLKSLNFM